MKRILLFVIFSYSFLGISQHSVILKSGDKMKGIVMGIELDTLSFFMDRKLKKIPLVELKSIFFDEYVPYDGTFNADEEEKTVKSGPYTIVYQMKDRVITKAPPISNATEKRGRVVVDVTIDRYGIVKRAQAGGSGSTTSDDYLYIKAEFAAKGTRFNEHIKGPITTNGTIIIDY